MLDLIGAPPAVLPTRVGDAHEVAGREGHRSPVGALDRVALVEHVDPVGLADVDPLAVRGDLEEVRVPLLREEGAVDRVGGGGPVVPRLITIAIVMIIIIIIIIKIMIIMNTYRNT